MNKPVKPNITIPESFAENGIKTDFDNEKLTNGFDRLQPDVLAGDNLNKFIDDTYKGLNYAMAGTDAINLIQEDEVLTVKNGELVSDSLANLKNKITNCILEAPNGAMSITPTSYTIKQGLKVLIPNGRNSDGTLKNIEYTIEQDETLEYISTTTTDRICFLIDKNDSHSGGHQAIMWWTSAVFVSEVEPKLLTDVLPYSNVAWYQPSTNKWWYTPINSSSPYNWEQIELCPIAIIDKQGTVELKKIHNFTPVSIAKEQDIDGEWVNYDATIFSSKTFSTSVTTYDLRDILPNDGCKYECIFNFSINIPANTPVAYHNLIAYSDLDFGRAVLMFENIQLSYTTYYGGYSHHIIVGSRRKLNVNLYSSSSATGRYTCNIVGYRKVR